MKENIVVQKYGGTSVATVDLIKKASERISKVKKAGNDVLVVVSAMGHTTDQLLDLAHQITAQPSEREYDMLLSTGEQVSIALLTMALHSLGVKAVSYTGAQAGIRTNKIHSKASIQKINAKRIAKSFSDHCVVVVAGFQGIDARGEITTLGRGGSDTTAVALAAALKADICEILTDVDGVYTADPRIVSDAQKLPEISYDEMLELASLGAQVLHPRAVECAKEYNVYLHVRSSLNFNKGTIVKEVSALEKQKVVSGIAIDKNTAKISIMAVPDVPGVAAAIFGALADAQINVDMIIQNVNRGNTNDISFTISETDFDKAVSIIKNLPENIVGNGVITDSTIAKISIVGAGMVSHPGVAAKMFKALGEESINIQMISTSEIKVSCIISAEDAEKAMKKIHKSFNLA